MTLIHAETPAGVRFELSPVLADEPTARKLACRVARFLSRCGRPGVWAAGRVTVSALGTNRLLFVARISAPGRDRVLGRLDRPAAEAE